MTIICIPASRLNRSKDHKRYFWKVETRQHLDMQFLSKVAVLLLTFGLTTRAVPEDGIDDGVDVTFPIHHQMKDSFSIFATRYAKTMAGCYAKYSKMECDATESRRLQMNVDQPSSQHNYTQIGFKKIRTPATIWGDIQKFYAKNKNEEHPELWPRANTYINSWDSATQMVSFEDRVRSDNLMKYSHLF